MVSQALALRHVRAFTSRREDENYDFREKYDDLAVCLIF